MVVNENSTHDYKIFINYTRNYWLIYYGLYMVSSKLIQIEFFKKIHLFTGQAYIIV